MLPTLADYLALIPGYNASKPDLRAVITAYLRYIIKAGDLLSQFRAGFDLDTAIGNQLDQVGLWVGRSRYVRVPLPSVFFSFDIVHLGFDEGVWKGPFDPISGLVRLDDDDYRLLIRAKIAANHWSGTVTDARAVLRLLFEEALDLGAQQILAEDGSPILAEDGSPILADPARFEGFYVEDKFDMSMVFGLAGKLPAPVFLALFLGGEIPLKPAGVKTYYLATSINNTPIFGFDMANGYISGFDESSWGTPDSSLITF